MQIIQCCGSRYEIVLLIVALKVERERELPAVALARERITPLGCRIGRKMLLGKD